MDDRCSQRTINCRYNKVSDCVAKRVEQRTRQIGHVVSVDDKCSQRTANTTKLGIALRSTENNAPRKLDGYTTVNCEDTIVSRSF